MHEGEWEHGHFSGCGRVILPDASQLIGHFHEGRQHGHGAQVFSSRRFEGHFKQGLKHGWGKETVLHRETYEGHFVNDNRQGSGKLSLRDGQATFEGDFWDN